MSSIDIAKWFILNNSDTNSESWDSKIKLQKLLFYSQAMHLAVTDQPLFTERIEAWKFGPVVREVYNQVERNSLITMVSYFGDRVDSKVNPEVIQMLKTVNFIYGQKSSYELVDLTHAEEPWKSLENQAKEQRNPEIKIDAIKKYYRSLKDVFEAHKDFDFDSHTSQNINGNRFVYNIKETALNPSDITDLRNLGHEVTGQSFFVYKDESGELVVY